MEEIIISKLLDMRNSIKFNDDKDKLIIDN